MHPSVKISFQTSHKLRRSKCILRTFCGACRDCSSRQSLADWPKKWRKIRAKCWLDENPQSRAISVMGRCVVSKSSRARPARSRCRNVRGVSPVSVFTRLAKCVRPSPDAPAISSRLQARSRWDGKSCRNRWTRPFSTLCLPRLSDADRQQASSTRLHFARHARTCALHGEGSEKSSAAERMRKAMRALAGMHRRADDLMVLRIATPSRVPMPKTGMGSSRCRRWAAAPPTSMTQ